MSFVKKLNKKNLVIIENIVFVPALVIYVCYLSFIYGRYAYQSISGKGYLGRIITPITTHKYYLSIAAVILIVNTTFILWEIFSLIFLLIKEGRKNPAPGYHKYELVFKKFAVHYKSSVLAMVIIMFLPKLLLLNTFWVWLPHFQKHQLFTINLKWYSWIYGYLCWEFSSWVWHFAAHRVRILWCIHAPHHSPKEINLMVNWLHFFAESYWTNFVFLLLSLLFGINPLMFIAIIAVDSVWGIFIHISERSVRDGRLGFLHHLMITPAHHRVHHSKNPLYLDRNFANVFPIWDWIMGTLQPIRDEVKTEYGISREMDVTNFSDLYFGEVLLLYKDIKNTDGIKNKLLYIFMPPGWTPVSTAKTSAVLRQEFLKVNPELGITSREKVFASIKSRLKGYKPEADDSKLPVSTAGKMTNIP